MYHRAVIVRVSCGVENIAVAQSMQYTVYFRKREDYLMNLIRVYMFCVICYDCTMNVIEKNEFTHLAGDE